MPDIEPKKPEDPTAWIKTARTSTLIQMLIHPNEAMHISGKAKPKSPDDQEWVAAYHEIITKLSIEIDRRIAQADGKPKSTDGPVTVLVAPERE